MPPFFLYSFLKVLVQPTSLHFSHTKLCLTLPSAHASFHCIPSVPDSALLSLLSPSLLAHSIERAPLWSPSHLLAPGAWGSSLGRLPQRPVLRCFPTMHYALSWIHTQHTHCSSHILWSPASPPSESTGNLTLVRSSLTLLQALHSNSWPSFFLFPFLEFCYFFVISAFYPYWKG